MSGDDHHDSSIEKDVESKTLQRKILDGALWFVKDQWFLIGIICVIVISSQVQVPESQQATKQVVVSYLAGTLEVVLCRRC